MSSQIQSPTPFLFNGPGPPAPPGPPRHDAAHGRRPRTSRRPTAARGNRGSAAVVVLVERGPVRRPAQEGLTTGHAGSCAPDAGQRQPVRRTRPPCRTPGFPVRRNAARTGTPGRPPPVPLARRAPSPTRWSPRPAPYLRVVRSVRPGAGWSTANFRDVPHRMKREKARTKGRSEVRGVSWTPFGGPSTTAGRACGPSNHDPRPLHENPEAFPSRTSRAVRVVPPRGPFHPPAPFPPRQPVVPPPARAARGRWFAGPTMVGFAPSAEGVPAPCGPHYVHPRPRMGSPETFVRRPGARRITCSRAKTGANVGESWWSGRRPFATELDAPPRPCGAEKDWPHRHGEPRPRPPMNLPPKGPRPQSGNPTSPGRRPFADESPSRVSTRAPPAG